MEIDYRRRVRIALIPVAKAASRWRSLPLVTATLILGGGGDVSNLNKEKQDQGSGKSKTLYKTDEIITTKVYKTNPGQKEELESNGKKPKTCNS